MKHIPFTTLLAAGMFFLFSSSAAMALGIVDLSGNTVVTTTPVEPTVAEEEAVKVVESTESSYDQGKSRYHRRDGEHRRGHKRGHKKGHHKHKHKHKHKAKKRWY